MQFFKSYYIFKILIERGNMSAMYNYVYMLENGNSIEHNYSEAIKYYKMAWNNYKGIYEALWKTKA